jgi:hypothetical protein
LIFSSFFFSLLRGNVHYCPFHFLLFNFIFHSMNFLFCSFSIYRSFYSFQFSHSIAISHVFGFSFQYSFFFLISNFFLNTFVEVFCSFNFIIQTNFMLFYFFLVWSSFFLFFFFY